MGSQYYGGAIWTNHALERLKERGLSQDAASDAFNNPERTYPGTQANTTQYQKRVGKSVITIVAKQNEKSEWIILSAWVDPPLSGSRDERRNVAYHKYKKASFWGKIWLTIKDQLGINNF